MSNCVHSWSVSLRMPLSSAGISSSSSSLIPAYWLALDFFAVNVGFGTRSGIQELVNDLSLYGSVLEALDMPGWRYCDRRVFLLVDARELRLKLSTSVAQCYSSLPLMAALMAKMWASTFPSLLPLFGAGLWGSDWLSGLTFSKCAILIINNNN